MSGTLSTWTGVGRLTRDAELKYLANGQAICHFSLVVDSREKNGGQWVDMPNYREIDLWGKLGESLNQYLTKGKLVAVSGEESYDSWKNDAGETKWKLKVKANTVALLSGGQRQESGGDFVPDALKGGAAAVPATVGADDFSDDIPF